MSFCVGVVKEISFSPPAPTALDTVLEALRSSSKGRLLYPEPFFVSILS